MAVDCIIDSVVPDNQSTCSSKFSLEPLLGKFALASRVEGKAVPDNQSTCSSKFSLEPLLGKFALASRVEGKASLGVDATEKSL